MSGWGNRKWLTLPMPSVSDFRSYFPGSFSDSPDDQIARTINEAGLLHDKSEEATLYLTAHLLAVKSEFADSPDGGAGIVSKEAMGPRSIEYMTTAGESEKRAFYSSTGYGRMFMAIEDRTPSARIAARIV